MPADKKALRALLLDARRARTAEQRAVDDAALCAAVPQLLTPAMSVAAYSPIGSEPGGPGFVEAIASHCKGVYLPISGADGNLSWAQYAGREAMRPGALGISEPTGPRHPSTLLAELDLIIAPAMAVSPAGARLGKGAGYYDRALAAVPTGQPPVVAVVHSTEVRAVPVDSHDRPVDGILTERSFHWI